MDHFIQKLRKTHSVSTKTHKPSRDLISDRTVEKVVKLLRCAYNQAVRWEIVSRNPFNGATITRPEYNKRDIWTADMIRTALDVCRDNKLYVAMNLAFACSMRMGEILGLQWSNVHITDEDIERDDAHVYIDNELLKLKLNHGDLKATQGDTGHAEIDMITKIYAHILDEDRKINAQRFENAFYSQPELRRIPSSQTKESEKTIAAIDPSMIIKQLVDSRELMNALASRIVAQAFARKDC